VRQCIVISVFGFECCNPNLCRRSTVAASVTTGRALRYAGGSARGLLHHWMGHCLLPWLEIVDHVPQVTVPAPPRTDPTPNAP